MPTPLYSVLDLGVLFKYGMLLLLIRHVCSIATVWFNLNYHCVWNEVWTYNGMHVSHLHYNITNLILVNVIYITRTKWKALNINDINKNQLLQIYNWIIKISHIKILNADWLKPWNDSLYHGTLQPGAWLHFSNVPWFWLIH